MSLKAKKKRRRLILLGGLLGAAGLLVAVYCLRLQLVDRQLVQGLAVGREALAAGDHVKALDKIGRYVQRHDDDAAALYDYGQARERVETPNRRHVGQAIRVYGKVLDLAPDHAAARSRLLDLYLQSGFNAETIATADELLRRSPDDPSAFRAKAIASARLRRNDDALKFAERYTDLSPLDLAGQVLRMQLMLQGGRPAADVRARAESLVAAHPDDARFELLCSIAASMTGDEKGAGTWARRAAAHARPGPDVLVLLANQLNVLRMYDEALGVLRRAADAEPVPEHVAPLVARLWETGRWTEVEARVASLPAREADETELLALRAMSLAALGRRSEAERHAAVLAARPLDPAAVAWSRVLPLATSTTSGGSGENFASAPGPSSAPASALQAAADRQVIEACEAALRQQPGHPYFHYFLGEAYARIGDADLALEHWQQALRRAPAWGKPVTRIAWALVAGSRPGEARDAARVAVDRAPHDADARAVLAWAWSETLSTPADAEALLKFVAETRSLAPADEQAPVIAAAVLAASGQHEQAVAAIRALIAGPKPPAAAAFLRLAEVSRRAKLGLEDECFDGCRRAHGLTPELALARAASLLRGSQPDEGLRLLGEGAAGGVGEPRHWQVARAQFLEAAGDASAAADAWVALAESASDDVPLLWAAFASPSLTNDRERRALILERLGRRVGDLGINWRLRRAEFLLHDASSQQELDEAAEILAKVTLERPRLVQPRLLLADALSKAGKADDAIEQLAAVVHLQPTSVSAPLELAELLQSQGEFGRAKEHLRVLLGGTHADTRDRRMAASLLARQGESGLALGVLQQLLDSGGGQQVPALLMASLHRAQGQPAQAEAIYRKLLETPDAATIQEAASFYASSGRVDDARRALAHLEALQSAAPALKALVLGNFEASYGDPSAALEHFEVAVAAEPGAVVGWQQLIAFHVANGDPAQAAKAIDRALDAAGGDPALKPVAKHRQLVLDLTTDPATQPLVLALLQPDQAGPAADALSAFAERKRDPGAPPDQLTARLAELAAKHPRHLALQSFLMRHYAGRRQFDQAIGVGTRTMHLLPAAAEPARLTAEALASAGRWQEALGAAERWRERSLAQPLPADMLTAAIYLRLGRPADAAARVGPHLAAALAEPDAGMPLILLSARAKVAADRIDDAAALVRPLLARSRECRLGWAELTAEPRAQARAGAWLDELAAHLDADAAEEVIGVAQAWRGLSRRTGDPAHAERSLEWLRRAERLARADAVPPVGAGSLLAVAVMTEEAGYAHAAAELYRRALARDPELPLALNNLAMIVLDQNGDAAEAASLAEGAVRLAPEVPNFHDTLAAARSRAGQYDQAITSLTTATRLDPNSAKWRINLAEACIATGRIRDARLQLDEVEAGHPNGSGLTEPVRRQLRSVRSLYQGKLGGAKQ